MQNFNYHQHTYRCKHADYNMEDEDYIFEYLKNGINKIAFTDHIPEKIVIDKRPNARMNYEELNDYLNSINTLKEKYKDKIDIKVGFEYEYADSQLDFLNELKDKIDILINGQHFIEDDGIVKIFGRYDFNELELNRYVEHLEKGIINNFTNIIAHPDIYMLKREFSSIEEDIANKICSMAEKYDIPLEINLNRIFYSVYLRNNNLNTSLDEKIKLLENVSYPCRGFWKVASKYNVRVLYGVDAHFKGQISLFNELVLLANIMIGKDTIDKLNFIKDGNI